MKALLEFFPRGPIHNLPRQWCGASVRRGGGHEDSGSCHSRISNFKWTN